MLLTKNLNLKKYLHSFKHVDAEVKNLVSNRCEHFSITPQATLLNNYTSKQYSKAHIRENILTSKLTDNYLWRLKDNPCGRCI